MSGRRLSDRWAGADLSTRSSRPRPRPAWRASTGGTARPPPTASRSQREQRAGPGARAAPTRAATTFAPPRPRTSSLRSRAAWMRARRRPPRRPRRAGPPRSAPRTRAGARRRRWRTTARPSASGSSSPRAATRRRTSPRWRRLRSRGASATAPSPRDPRYGPSFPRSRPWRLPRRPGGRTPRSGTRSPPRRRITRARSRAEQRARGARAKNPHQARRLPAPRRGAATRLHFRLGATRLRRWRAKWRACSRRPPRCSAAARAGGSRMGRPWWTRRSAWRPKTWRRCAPRGRASSPPGNWTRRTRASRARWSWTPTTSPRSRRSDSCIRPAARFPRRRARTRWPSPRARRGRARRARTKPPPRRRARAWRRR